MLLKILLLSNPQVDKDVKKNALQPLKSQDA